MSDDNSQSVRRQVAASRRWVVKIGSALLTNDGQGLDQLAIAGWVQQIVQLRQRGIEVVLVSSGSVAEGMARLGWKQRPKAIHDLQAAAAVGQMGLVQTWEQSFKAHDVHSAQVLVTHDDLSDRKRYLNARSTLLALISHGVVPVVNENDTVVTDEIRFGDNDTLGALVTNLVEADLLVILTDQDGMFDADPRTNPSARLISHARASDPALVGVAGGSAGSLGRGGMATKLRAAQLAARSGAASIIVGGRLPAVLSRIQQAEAVGTLLTADESPMAARKQWLAGHLQMRGVLTLDAGAAKVLREKGVSLLPVGVRDVTGNFSRGEMVSCVGPDNQRVACGLVNYSAEEARRIMGKSSDAIASILGYVDEKELIHRDNMVVF
ncbi:MULTISPECIES: glutamate 5-kinase [unclassified Ketobacter]|uniref:glutamate 5-kinase n=1 Tax=unclassified Ketobacter TaxID=2639109 RepID=UPI0025C63933|nr:MULTISPECIES: glutamate 5-kinase [unclassified Ketobacter]